MTALTLAGPRAFLVKAWSFFHGVMGDQAYERYVEGVRRDGGTPLSPADFYVDSLKRRYSTVSRCC
jgi:uncharacterized short protein YbdD (DUF466 family)